MVQHKEHPPEVWSFPLVTPCIRNLVIFSCLHSLMWWLNKSCWAGSCYTNILVWRYR